MSAAEYCEGRPSLASLFKKHYRLIRVKVGVLAGRSLELPVGGEAHYGLLLLTALGGDEHYTVSTTHTVNGGCRCVLKNRDGFDIVGGDLRE